MYSAEQVGLMLSAICEKLDIKLRLFPFEKGDKAIVLKQTKVFSFDIVGNDKSVFLTEGTTIEIISAGFTKKGEPIFYFIHNNLKCQVWQNTSDFVSIKSR